jgi:hypothetical protein
MRLGAITGLLPAHGIADVAARTTMDIRLTAIAERDVLAGGRHTQSRPMRGREGVTPSTWRLADADDRCGIRRSVMPM